jgi:hypothetical protein
MSQKRKYFFGEPDPMGMAKEHFMERDCACVAITK